MPAAKLKELLSADVEPKPGAIPAAAPARARMVSGRGNLLSQAIALVLHFPAAARAVQSPERLANLPVAGIQVLRELIEQAQTPGTSSTAVLLERWRERPEFRRLSELAITPPVGIEADSAAAELTQAIEKLEQTHGPQRRVDELLRKAQEIGLNYDEKVELSALLKERGARER